MVRHTLLQHGWSLSQQPPLTLPVYGTLACMSVWIIPHADCADMHVTSTSYSTTLRACMDLLVPVSMRLECSSSAVDLPSTPE